MSPTVAVLLFCCAFLALRESAGLSPFLRPRAAHGNRSSLGTTTSSPSSIGEDTSAAGFFLPVSVDAAVALLNTLFLVVREVSLEGDVHLQEDLAFYHSLTAAGTGQNASLSAAINASLAVLADALRLYGPDSVVASYNGGKDADVVMSLMRAGKYAD